MAENFLKLTITSNVNDFHSDRTFPSSTTVGDLKCKLELLTGVAPSLMQLELKTAEGKFICKIPENNETNLNSLNVQNGMIIHVLGTSELVVDEDKVAKFEISDEAYEKRTDSVRAWKQKQHLAEYDPEYQKKKQAELERIQIESEKLGSGIKVGQRCEVRLANQLPKRGTVRYSGPTSFKPGHWIGVQYDEPVGKHDGTVDGQRYFNCPPKYGSFLRPQDVIVGEFPEENLQEMDEF